MSTDREGDSDEDLMASLQSGDDAALDVLISRWEIGAKTFLLQLGVASADADDVAQDAFVRIYEKRATFRRGQAFKPWFLTVVGNLGRNRQRWRGRRREAPWAEVEDASNPSFFSTDVTAAEAALQKEAILEVRRAVESLPDPLREAVQCVDLAELSHQEAAKVLGCTPKAIETRLHRARAQLQALLRRYL